MKKSVVFFDFDSTVVTKETLDETIALALARHPERERLVREIEEITNLGMEGRLAFTESVRRRMRVVPLNKTLLQEVGTGMLSQITDGMPDIFLWLQEQGHRTCIVSGGFYECIAPTSQKLNVNDSSLFTNRFVFDESGVVARVDETSLLWTDAGKTPVLQAVRKQEPNAQFIMVGDGMNDYRAYESGAADLFIGFGGNVIRQAVKDKAPHFAHTAESLFTELKKYVATDNVTVPPSLQGGTLHCSHTEH